MPGGIKGAVQEISGELEEAVVKPVQQEVGQLIETAQQSTQDPQALALKQQQIQKQKQDDAKKAANIKTFLNKMAQDEQRLKQLRQEEAQKKQMEQQEQHEEKQKKELEKKKKDESFEAQHIKALQTKAERKLGVGG